MAAKKASKSTAIAKWDEELAKFAEESAKMEENSGGGQFFSIRAGVLSFQDNQLPNNEMAVIIIDSIIENTYYEGEYDPDVPAAPTCFAFGRVEDEMAPHKLVFEAGNQQCGTSGLCDGCEMNEFGSADKGRGKACKNTRRLAMIPVGRFTKDGSLDLIEDLEHYQTVEPGYMKLPVTSVKGYSTFVKQVATSLKRPPFGIITKVKVIPDPKSQFKVIFEPLMNVPDELMGAVMKRHEDIKAVIDFPYVPFEEEEKPAKKSTSKKPVAKSTATKRRKY